jgi:hypothetical protein
MFRVRERRDERPAVRMRTALTPLALRSQPKPDAGLLGVYVSRLLPF